MYCYMPLLIFDDRCYMCGKFAHTARRLSRGRIDIVGHYSEQGLAIKKKIFAEGFDPSTMFWLVKGKTAFGSRSGLIAVAVEIAKGIFRPSSNNDTQRVNMVCSNEELSCNKLPDVATRIYRLIKNGKKIETV